jgi:hypothetical protein
MNHGDVLLAQVCLNRIVVSLSLSILEQETIDEC